MGMRLTKPGDGRTRTAAGLASFALADADRPPLQFPPLPPDSDELRILTTMEEVRDATEAVVARGQRLISIFSPDLEPLIYDQPAFLATIKRFVLGQSFAKARVLVREPGRMMSHNNRFVAMARRLTSYLEIRVLAAELRGQTASYCIADDHAIVYRLRADRWDGITALNNPPVARQYLQEFDLAWQASTDSQHQRVGNL
jgi:hypothetical protein